MKEATIQEAVDGIRALNPRLSKSTLRSMAMKDKMDKRRELENELEDLRLEDF